MSKIVDARGLRCPWPVLRLAKAMADAGDVIILVEDTLATDEVLLLARERDWHVTAIDGGMIVSHRGA